MNTDDFLVVLNCTDSTNNYAMQMINDHLAKHGMAIATWEQTNGKGQRSKNWLSEKGMGINLSVIFNMENQKKEDSFKFLASMALACHDFFSGYAGEGTRIKWPNDIYWGDRKAGGILIESKFRGNKWKWAVVGIGININQVVFNPGLPNPVSMKQVTKKDHDLDGLYRPLYSCIRKRFDELDSDTIISEYNMNLYRRSEKILLKKENTVFETILKEVSGSGEMITRDLVERRFVYGEVDWVL
jgi:BirA family biotin operon repressor/biotin-[acetyl-CoA-carboxylase] ligase